MPVLSEERLTEARNEMQILWKHFRDRGWITVAPEFEAEASQVFRDGFMAGLGYGYKAGHDDAEAAG